jgi:hypothetical protein
MKETIIKFETAILAKEKGFNNDLQWCGFAPCSYDEKGNFWKNTFYGIEAPTQSLLKKWLRDKYHLYVRVGTTSLTTHFPMIELVEVDGTRLKGPVYIKNYQTYEEGLEVGLFEALKLIKIP